MLLRKDKWMPPGYRTLVPLQFTEPLPLTDIQPGDETKYTRASDGVIYSLHTHLHRDDPTGVMHGPAWASKGSGGWPDEDWINAYASLHWPEECKDWEKRVQNKQWPSENVRKDIKHSGCLVVPVSHKEIQHPTLYRLSTTEAERLIMFELNITQLRCLIILKQLVKTYINQTYPDCMKSFNLKTAVFYSCEMHEQTFWSEENTVNCVLLCLKWLRSCLQENCLPHYFQSTLDMLEGRLSLQRRNEIVCLINNLIKDPVSALLKVQLDNLGDRLGAKLGYTGTSNFSTYTENKEKIGHFLSNLYIDNFPFDYNVLLKNDHFCEFDLHQKVLQGRIALCEAIEHGNHPYRAYAAKRYRLLFSATLGILKICRDISSGISEDTLQLLECGIHSDNASGKLKLATAVYATGDLKKAESLLDNIENDYDLDKITPVCLCYRRTKVFTPKAAFSTSCIDSINSNNLFMSCAFCVVFTPNESCCLCPELKNELKRLPAEIARAPADKQIWLKFACIDSLPYLYFLQFKVYSDSTNPMKQVRTLKKLQNCIDTENLFHKETALNLLGQCFENMNKFSEALGCYQRSLEERHEFNAAAFLIKRIEGTDLSI